MTEVIDELPKEKTKLNEVIRVWLGMMKHFERDLQLWEAIDS